MNDRPIMPMRRTVCVRLEDIAVCFGSFVAVDGFSARIEPGEILALLGPSGCGKTTTLRVIAGLHAADSGAVYFDDERVDDLAPHRRNVGMLFQNYALFPHMTVLENVLFGLHMRRVPRAEWGTRAQRVLDMLHIGELRGSYPAQLSGGQQQRAALARTLVVEPSVLLLDEPLSALDRQLRDAMRTELRGLLKTVGITAIIVTHDQDEALTIADRVVVMRNGRIEQMGTPKEVYRSPRTRFVASFIGRTNYLPGEVVEVAGDTAAVRIDGHATVRANRYRPCSAGDRVEVAVRPEAIMLIREGGAIPAGGNVARGRIAGEVFVGGTTEYKVELAGGGTVSVLQTENAAGGCAVGDTVLLCWAVDRAAILADSEPPATGVRQSG